MCQFSYDVIYFYGITNGIATYRRETGIGYARDWPEAMEKLFGFYGDDLIAVKHLELFDGHAVIPLPQDVIDNVVGDKYYDPVSGASYLCTESGEKIG